MRRALIRIALGSAALFVMITALVHVPSVQRLMGWRDASGNAACPFGHDRPSPAITAVRPRPVLGFVLGETTREELVRWGEAHGARCSKPKRGAALVCENVLPAMVGQQAGDVANATVWLELDGRALLRAVRISARSLQADTVAAAFERSESRMRETAGSPTRIEGDVNELALGAFRQASTERSLVGYRAVVRATNMGDGYLLTESHVAY